MEFAFASLALCLLAVGLVLLRLQRMTRDMKMKPESMFIIEAPKKVVKPTRVARVQRPYASFSAMR